MLIKYYHQITRTSLKVSFFSLSHNIGSKKIDIFVTERFDFLYYWDLISDEKPSCVTFSPNRITLQALSPEIYFKPTYRRAYSDWDYKSGCLQMYFSL